MYLLGDVNFYKFILMREELYVSYYDDIVFYIMLCLLNFVYFYDF